MLGASFDSTKTYLLELLTRIRSGSLQLPDFQRGWVWEDERIRSLLASVSVSFPIGAVMLLQTGGEHVRFKPRAVSGTDDALDADPVTLILDGQQRLTALYWALMGTSAVETSDAQRKSIHRWYYFNMEAIVQQEADREDTVLSVPKNRVVKAFGGAVVSDVSSPEREYEEELSFQSIAIFDSNEWRHAYHKHWDYDRDKIQLFDKFSDEVIDRFKQYQVPVIELKKETPKEAVCLVFERVNTGGVALNVFELLTASFASENFQLRDDWDAREKRMKHGYPVLQNLQSDDFLQAISLLANAETQAGGTQRRDDSRQGSGYQLQTKGYLEA